jgi:photosystem II stability/assembly factor-like uncharacterized protein
MRSGDGGVTRTPVGPDDALVLSLAVSPDAPHLVYAGTWDKGLLRSSDGGDTWTSICAAGVESIAFTPGQPFQVFAGTYGDGVYRSIDRGDTWGLFSEGLTNPNVWAVAAAHDGSMLYAGTGTSWPARAVGVFVRPLPVTQRQAVRLNPAPLSA